MSLLGKTAILAVLGVALDAVAVIQAIRDASDWRWVAVVGTVFLFLSALVVAWRALGLRVAAEQRAAKAEAKPGMRIGVAGIADGSGLASTMPRAAQCGGKLLRATLPRRRRTLSSRSPHAVSSPNPGRVCCAAL